MRAGKIEYALATCQAHNTLPISHALAIFLTERLGTYVTFLGDVDWRNAYNGIASGEIAVGWICGRPYVRLIDEARAPIRLLVAPVMVGERYGDRPIYFSDVVVRDDSSFTRFEDLRGATWAYNEPGSQSGYHITLYHLALMGERGPYFKRVIASGAHLRSIEMILSGEVDASAIDSTVLEWELEKDPSLAKKIRIIDTLGPSPIPPLVVSAYLPPSQVNCIRNSLLTLQSTPEGRVILQEGRLSRFAPVTDADYDVIREMVRLTEGMAL